MLYVKFRDHKTSCAGELLKVFTIDGHSGHLVHVFWTISISFVSPSQ